jgi:8-amino-7-oxononanoate synthase
VDFTQQLQNLKEQNLYRQVLTNENLIDFCSNDYLGLKNHPKVIESFKKGADLYGIGSGGSHLVSGHLKPHAELEEYLADFIGVEKILLFSSGYMANLGIFSALKDDINWVLQDKLNHASLIDGNFLIGKKINRYKHNDTISLKNKLDKQDGFGLIATDNIFSMDGDIAKIKEISSTIDENKAVFMQDDAHGFGIYPSNIPKNSIYMATFGKAIGTYGAFVGGNADFIDYLIQKSRPYTYTTATPPAISVATIQALRLTQSGELQEKLFNNIKLFKSIIDTNSNTAIQPIKMRDNTQALKTSEYLKKEGFLVKAIRKPTVINPILRVTISEKHNKNQITKLAELLQKTLIKK